MPAEINLFFRTATGGKAHIKVSGDTFQDAGKELVEALIYTKSAEWVEDTQGPVAPRTSFGGVPETKTGPTPPPIQSGEYICVEDGSVITGETVQGNRFTAQQIAAGRDKKSRELGLNPPGPRCADCWKRGGYAGRYKALKGYS